MGDKKQNRLRIVSLFLVCILAINFALPTKKQEVKANPAVAIAVGVPIIAAALTYAGVTVASGQDLTAISNQIYRNASTDIKNQVDTLGAKLQAGALGTVMISATLMNGIFNTAKGVVGTTPQTISLVDYGIGQAVTSPTLYSSTTSPINVASCPVATTFASQTYGNIYTTAWGECTLSYTSADYSTYSYWYLTTPTGTQYRFGAQVLNKAIYASSITLFMPIIYGWGTASPQIKMFWRYNGGSVGYDGNIGTFGTFYQKYNGTSWVDIGANNMLNDIFNYVSKTTGTGYVDQTQWANTAGSTIANDVSLNVSRDISTIAGMSVAELTATREVNTSILDQTVKITAGFSSIVYALQMLPSLIATALTNLFNSIVTAVSTIGTNIVNAVNALPSAIATALTNLFNSIVTAVNTIGTNIVNAVNTVQSVCADIKTGIQTLVQDAGTIINTSLTNILNAINTGVESIVDALGNVTGGVIEWGQSFVDAVVNAIESALTWAFVPADTFWVDTYEAVSEPIIEKFPQDITIINALKVDSVPFHDINVSLMGTPSATIIEADDIINSKLDFVRSATSAMWVLLLVLYVWRKVNGFLVNHEYVGGNTPVVSGGGRP